MESAGESSKAGVRSQETLLPPLAVRGLPTTEVFLTPET